MVSTIVFFSSPLVLSLPKVFQYVLARAHSKCHDWHGRRLVRRTGKNAGIANVAIFNVVALRPTVRNKLPGIVAKAARSSLVQTRARHIGLISYTSNFGPDCFEKCDDRFLGVL